MPGVQAFSFPSNESFARHQFPLGVGGGSARAPPLTFTPTLTSTSLNSNERKELLVGRGVKVGRARHPPHLP